MKRMSDLDRGEDRRLAELHRRCAEWNAAHPIGTPVTVTVDSGRTFSTSTRSRAQVLSGHTAVIWLAGISGCYALERVQQRATWKEVSRG
jgi:hypothetical protein